MLMWQADAFLAIQWVAWLLNEAVQVVLLALVPNCMAGMAI